MEAFQEEAVRLEDHMAEAFQGEADHRYRRRDRQDRRARDRWDLEQEWGRRQSAEAPEVAGGGCHHHRGRLGAVSASGSGCGKWPCGAA